MMIGESPEKGLAAVRRFFFLAYAITWVLLAPWFYAYTVIYHGQVPLWLWAVAPLAFVGGWGPTVSALILAARAGGLGEVRRLLGSVTRWHVPVRWYALTFALPPLIVVISLLIVDRGVSTLSRFSPGAASAGLPLIYLIALPFGPLGEELGWRGYALPRLIARFGPVKASLLLGIVWTFWHVPMMLWFPGASIPDFMPLSFASVAIFLIQITAETVLMTYLYMRTNGSVLLTILAHVTLNTAASVVYAGLPHLGSAQRQAVYPVDAALLVILALMSLIGLSRQRVSGMPRPMSEV